MNIFIQVIFPALLVFLSGFFIQKRRNLDIRSISTIAVYIFVPCLVFQSLYETKFDQQYLYMVVFDALLILVTILIIKLYVKMKHFNADTESAFILSTVFMNAGNFGSPIILFAYGEKAFHFAISFFVLQTIALNSIGLYYAARKKGDIKKGFINMLKLPAIYAVILALLLKEVPLRFPDNIYAIIELLAYGAIPTVMVILGMQIADLTISTLDWKRISFVTIIRLMLAPILTFLLTLMFPMDPLLRKVLIVLTAMPTAVNASTFAIEFNTDPKFVSSVTIINTLISFFTITILIEILS
ncbi:AEC family transporter [Pseudalkalibacillus decolorationis]|uniref:AEC family transporter n=1 Tax=Pseudalkalibacillus decolorationis TaxID=163879 RepID=UPI00214787F7|nr:AEC family transporter [Pseudalkalibacillus decolorationis]